MLGRVARSDPFHGTGYQGEEQLFILSHSSFQTSALPVSLFLNKVSEGWLWQQGGLPEPTLLFPRCQLSGKIPVGRTPTLARLQP